MGKPLFMDVTPEIAGSVILCDTGKLLVSAFHKPTGRVLNGQEDSLERALSWLDGAALVFSNPEGRA